MDINALRQALLPFENRATGTFVMPASSLQGDTWASVRSLLQGSLAAQTLTLGGITAWPPDPAVDTIAYAGTGTLFPWGQNGGQATLQVTAWFTLDGQGNPQLRVEAVPDTGGGWGLGASLDGLSATVLSGVRFDDGAFLLTSVQTTASGFPGPVPPGTSFAGTVSLAGPFAWMGGVLPTPASRALAGAVDLSRPAAPSFTLAPPFARTVAVGTGEPDGGVQMGAGAELSAGFIPYAGATDGSGWQVSRAAVLAYVSTGSGKPVWMRMPLGADGTAATMAMVGEPVELAGWSDLTSLAAGVSVDIIPAAVPQGPRLFLNGLEMGLHTGDGTASPTRGFVAFDVSLDTGGWDILPNGILTVDALGAALTVNLQLSGALAAVGSVYGRVTLAGVMPLTVALSIPALEASMRLDDGSTVSLAALMEQFMTRLTGRGYRPPIDMTLTQFEAAVSVTTGQFNVQGQIVTDWSVSLGTTSSGGSLITLAFEGIQWFLGYDGRTLGGEITAFTAITAGGQAATPGEGDGTDVATTARFYLSAATAGGDDAGWLLSMGLTDESTLSISALLEAFMYPGEQKPGGSFNVPTLVVNRLALSMTTDAGNTPFAYTIGAGVEGSWNFQPIPGSGPTLQLAASFDLLATRPVDAATKRVQEDGEWSISGSVEGTFSIYGLQINAGYQFEPTNSALTFGVWYGERGIQATVTRKQIGSGEQARTETILTVRLGDLSLGEILDFLIGLAVPGEGRRLPSPWDVLYQVNFRDLSLQVNLDTYDVEVDYALNLKLGFATIQKIGLIYSSAGGEGSVMLRLTGDFLGQPYGTDDTSEPLGWDVIRDPAPAVPGKGTGLVDITYVGMGQHVALPVPDSQLKTVEQVIAALKASMGPPSGGGSPLGGPDTQGLRYDANSKWLFGVQATVMETVSFSAVLYDPHLYGALVELFGPRAGPLAGLRFELLYRRITDDIGEFSVDLRVPDQFRQWEFGAVSVTLGIIHVDVYTNGNFRINAGFPANGDFSVSFGVQWFPFIGQGGFYFAYLNGTTSERVPRITNGTFDPVIEAGVGLAVGVGKQINRGPLKAGLSLEVYAILEGIYAPFHPYDVTLPRDTYYWFQGTAGIVGKLYGSVDFVVIKVSVSVVVRAQAVITIEAHQPTIVALSLEVEAEASIKVLFITIHFSFSLTLDTSFTIGSRTTPPWVVGQPPPQQQLQARAMALQAESSTGVPAGDTAQTAMLRQQGAQARTRTMSRVDVARFHTSLFAVDGGAPAKWAPVAVYGEGAFKTAQLQFVPGFTIAGPSTLAYGAPSQPGDANQLQVVLMLVAENTIDPGAVTAEEVARGSTDHLHATDDEGTAAFPRMVETFFRWAAQAGAGVSGTQTITAAQVASLLQSLQDPEFIAATFDYDGNLQPFLQASLHFQVVNCPSDGTPANTSGTFVAMIPEITASVSFDQGTAETRDYGVFNAPAQPDRFAENLAAYFEQLATDYLANSANDPLLAAPPQTLAAASMEAVEDETVPSMAELVFGEYFALLTRVAVQGAADLLAEYPYAYPQENGPSLAQLAAQFDPMSVTVAVPAGATPESVAASLGVAREDLAVQAGALEYARSTVELPVGVTPLSIAQDNQGAALRAGAKFNAAGLPYQVRAAQTLNGIAAAIPQQVTQAAPGAGILGPLTGAAIGAANASRAGMLRPTATLAIPSFTYTPVTGDTDTFLAAFWQVRNQGVIGIPNLDWYTQAISTLNPGGTIDWSAPTGTLVVPSAFQNTATTATYTVHGGDTLERIAGQLALWQAGPAGVAVGVITTQPMQHVVTSTDTLASVAGIYPGLAQADLVTANAAADVLAPLTPVVLPGFGVSIAAGETLAGLAQAFDVTLSDLVALVRTTGNLFAATAPASGNDPAVPPLVLRGVPGLPVDDVVASITAPATCNPMAAQVSRFLLHGLRVPSPADTAFTDLTPEQVLEGQFTGTLYGAFEMTGVQFPWPAPAKPLSITLSATADWVTLMAAATLSGAGGTAGAAMLAASPALARGNAVVMATEVATSISVTLLDEPPFDAWIPDTTLTLGATAEVMRLADTGPRHYDLQASIHWQAADPPELDGTTQTEAPGEPGIWLFPDTLRTAARSGASPTPNYALRGLSLDAPPGTEGKELAEYAWSVQVPFIVHRVPSPPLPGQSPAEDPGASGRDSWITGSYVVEGADQAGEDLLYELWTHLAANAAPEAGTQLFLLYPPSAASAAPSGLASDRLAADGVVLLKTNLGTETRDPGPPVLALALRETDEPAEAEGGEDREIFSAGLGDATAFVTYLWQATSVRAGGFYLRYDVQGRGIPDFVFDESGRGTLYLQCLLGSQTGTSPGRGLLPFNNCAVVLDNVDASATQVYAVQTGGTPPMVKMATVPPGNVGYTITRPSPEPRNGDPATPQQRTGLLYNLFGYAVDPGGGFVASNECLPAGPAPAPDGSGKWYYQQVIEASRLAAAAGRIAQHGAALPSPDRDPYAGVSSTASVEVEFAAHDAFGNQAAPTDPLAALPIPFRYIDAVIGVGEWPGAAASYTVQPADGGATAPSFVVSLALQAGNYVPAPGVETAVALQTASTHALRYQRVFYQLNRPGVGVTATTTLAPSALTLSRARFAEFVNGAYVFTSQVAALPPVGHTTGGGETLGAVATAYSVTVQDLLAANQDMEAAALFAGPAVVPVFDRVKHGETLNAFAARNQTTAAALLQTAVNLEAPVPAGVSLAITPRTVPADATLTLSQMAAAQGCTVADIANANHAATGLLADAVQLWVRGLSVVTSASTFDSVAAAFATQGLQVAPGEVASANADMAGIFAGSAPGAPVSYTVDRWTSPQASTLTGIITAQFAGSTAGFLTLNGGTAGVIAQSTPLQLRVDSITPPAGTTVNGWAERVLRISVAQLAAANAGGTGVPALVDGVPLIIPALLDPTPLSAVPYAIPGGTSLRDVADRFGVGVDALGESIQDIPGIFTPGQSVSVGTMGPVTTDGEDSIATLLAKFTGPAVPTLDQLIDAIAPSTTLLRAGAAIVTPPARVAGGETTLAAAARLFGFADASLVARANASLDGFLDPAKTATVDGAPITVGPHGTLTSLYRRVLQGGAAMEFDAFLDAVATQDLLREGASFLLPPPPATASAPLPADPAVTAAITELQATITVARPQDEVSGDFGAGSDVASKTSPVAAQTSGVPASYTAFAQGVEDAWAGRLRVALGKPASATGPGRPRLYAVRFEAAESSAAVPALRAVEVDNTPSFFSLPPLCTELISRTAGVRVYQSGADDPLPPATQATVFRAVDVQQWAAGVLGAIDLVLSTPYAVPAFLVTRGDDGTSPDFDRLVAAKKTLAGTVSGQLQAVIPAAPTADAQSAIGALRQTLDVSLSEGWNTAAVVQLPTTVDATWAPAGLDAGSHRFAGKPLPPSLPLDTATTLGGIAGGFHVHPAAIAQVLGGTPNLLRPGVVLASPQDPGVTWTIAQHDTLQDGADTLGMSLDDFAVAFADQAPLFRDGASATVNGASAITTSAASLAGVADTLAAGVAFLSVANQSVAGLLAGTVYVHGVPYPVTSATSSLAGLAAAANLTVEELGQAIAGQAVLVGGITLYVAALLPDYSLSAGRIDLDAAAGNLNLLLQLADPAWYRRLLLDVNFQLTGLEYGVQDAPLTDGYQTSDWLHFVTPLSGVGVVNPATLDTDIGQVDVPIPLRAYPTPPRLAGQYAAATNPDVTADPADVGESVIEAKAWTYAAAFQTQEAAQDVVWLRVGANFAPVVTGEMFLVTLDPFTALAQWAVNDPAIQADLRNLLLPYAALAASDDLRKKARSAVQALGLIAESVAQAWGPIAPDAAPEAEAENIAPEQEWVFTLETRTRSSTTGTPLIDALLLTRDPASATAGWGPDGQLPVLGYVADDGTLRLLQGEPVGGHDDQREYRIDDADVAAFTTRTFMIRYEALDAVATQNARTSVWLTRNERLVPGRETNHAFVYRTPETHFADVASPAIVRSTPISIGSGPVDGLTAAAEAAFTQLLGDPPADARTTEKLTVRFGVWLVPPSGDDPGIPMLSPVVFRPLFAYTDDVPGQITDAFKAWLAAGNQPPAGVTAFVSLEVMVFSGILPDRQVPLLDILRLDYALTSTSAEGDGDGGVISAR